MPGFLPSNRWLLESRQHGGLVARGSDHMTRGLESSAPPHNLEIDFITHGQWFNPNMPIQGGLQKNPNWKGAVQSFWVGENEVQGGVACYRGLPSRGHPSKWLPSFQNQFLDLPGHSGAVCCSAEDQRVPWHCLFSNKPSFNLNLRNHR